MRAVTLALLLSACGTSYGVAAEDPASDAGGEESPASDARRPEDRAEQAPGWWGGGSSSFGPSSGCNVPPCSEGPEKR